MRKIVVLSFISLDGVMQAPGGKGEDPSNGFDLEGWTFPFFDDVAGEEMGRQMELPYDLLLGRKTYDIFAGYWPERDSPFNSARKYVVSHEPFESSWEETIQISSDVPEELRKLRAQDGPMIQVHGSGELIQTLLAHDLVDELWLKTFPVVLGKGKVLFGPGTRPSAFELTSTLVSPSGVIFANYRRNGEVQTGSF
jgi:dihydrofolate reductase